MIMTSTFKVARVWDIDGQTHAELNGDDGFLSFHRPRHFNGTSDNLVVGEKFTLVRDGDILNALTEA